MFKNITETKAYRAICDLRKEVITLNLAAKFGNF